MAKDNAQQINKNHAVETEPIRHTKMDTLSDSSTKSLGKRKQKTEIQPKLTSKSLKKAKLEKSNPENSLKAIEERLAAHHHAEKIMSKYLNNSCPDPKLSWLVYTIKLYNTTRNGTPTT